MKYMMLFLITLNAHAISIGQYISSPQGSSIQTFEVTKESATYDKKSNFFDKKKDFSIGTFRMQKGDVSQEFKTLSKALEKIKVTDEILKKKNSDFNALSTKRPHESFITIENYRISQDSILYPELKNVFDRLLEKNWKQESGVVVTEDLSSVVKYKKGKVEGKEPFNLPFHCDKNAPPTVCSFKDLGIIFIK